jgi:tRNA modification GTPase
MTDSDFVLLMLDGSRALDEDDEEIFGESKGKKRVVILNKHDLPQKISMDEVKKRFVDDPIVSISALKDEGIDDLKKIIYSSLVHRDVRATPEHLIVANVRHKTALTEMKDYLSNAMEGMEEETSPEFIAFEIRSALEVLGELVGETTSEEVLSRIFEQFCIGK